MTAAVCMLQYELEQLPYLHRMHESVCCRQLALQRLRYCLLSLYNSETPFYKGLLESGMISKPHDIMMKHQ